MELLINDILKLGGRRDRLKAKVFGGARMIVGLSDIGKLNGDFT
jgi:chemotaxis protein CheD